MGTFRKNMALPFHVYLSATCFSSQNPQPSAYKLYRPRFSWSVTKNYPLNVKSHTIQYIVYLVVIVITCYFWPLDQMPAKGEVRYIHFTPNFVTTFPVQVFAFTCAQNASPSI